MVSEKLFKKTLANADSFLIFQTEATFIEIIRESDEGAARWMRERTQIRPEEIPDEDQAEALSLADVEVLQQLDHDELEAEVDAMKESGAGSRPDLVLKSFSF